MLRRKRDIWLAVLGGAEITPELAAAVGIAGHNWGGRHAAWISRRSGKGFIGTTVVGGFLSLILVVVGSLLVVICKSKRVWYKERMKKKG